MSDPIPLSMIDGVYITELPIWAEPSLKQKYKEWQSLLKKFTSWDLSAL